MSQVSHFGFFNLPQIPLDPPYSTCIQPAESFNATQDDEEYTFPPTSFIGSQYVELTLERAMHWHWQIKAWEAELDIIWNTTDENGDPIEIPFQTTFDVKNGSGFVDEDFKEFESERQKIIGTGFSKNPSSENYGGGFFNSGFFNGSKTVEGENNTPTFAASVLIGGTVALWKNYPETPSQSTVSQAGQVVRASSDFEKFYIPIQFYLTFEREAATYELINGQDSNSSEGVEGTATWVISDDFEETSKPFRYTDIATEFTGEFKITPTEYWTYS